MSRFGSILLGGHAHGALDAKGHRRRTCRLWGRDRAMGRGDPAPACPWGPLLLALVLLGLWWGRRLILDPPSRAKPEFTFGVITDVQYADLSDGFSVLGFRRFYRRGIPKVQCAVQAWRREPGMRFAVHLGDIVDAHNGNRSEEALSEILRAFGAFEPPVFHLVGNHDLSCLPRATLRRMLMPGAAGPAHGPDLFYRAFRQDFLDLIFLDSYDLAVIGWPAGHPRQQQASAFLTQRNPNANLNRPPATAGPECRFTAFNGGIGAAQLAWLRQTLQHTAEAGRRAVVFCHTLVLPGSGHEVTLLWNYEEVLEVLRETPAVAAVFSGHFHPGGYARDPSGIHFVTLNGSIECHTDECYGSVDVYRDRLVLRGYGTQRALPFR